jgi:hypothetical protein
MQSGKTEAKRSPSKPGRVSLLPQEFKNLINDQGIKVRVTPAILCPNISDLDTYNHELGCSVCDGNGIVDVDAKAKETWAFIQSVNKDNVFGEGGIFEMRDAQMTILAEDRVNYWYKVEVLAFTTQFNELVERVSTGDVDQARYDIQGTADYNDWCIVDKAGNLYEKDTDYTVLDRGITWITANKPVDGTIYSFTYPMLPTFRVLDMMHENRYYYNDFKQADKTPIHLPQQSHIRFDYFVKGKGYQNEAPVVPPGGGTPPPFKPGFGST